MTIRNGRSDKIRTFLIANPGATHAAVVEHCGEPQPFVHRTLVQLRQLGFVERRDGVYYCVRTTPKTQRYTTDEERQAARRETKRRFAAKLRKTDSPPRRVFASEEERRQAKLEKDRRYEAKRKAARAAARAAMAPKPAASRIKARPAPQPLPKSTPLCPQQVRVKPSRRIKDDAAFTPSAMLQAPVDKPDPSATEAFIRAHPDRFERIPMDAPWRQYTSEIAEKNRERAQPRRAA